ncbi:MAG TPA: MtrB/PioB family decaheme-associated outer membrane protein [Vicinamibacterales bacterium]|jgi:MtrB/PioB family decaheme-associated outer membrane protein|nr:MtrB/PioB family decaheme-associated outer membrane protein [Vicinamibacterales bacterium]
MRRLPFSAFLLLAAAVTTSAQSPAPAASELQVMPNEVVFGARLNSTPAMGRFMRYDDLRSGPLLERLRVSRDHDAWTFAAEVRNAGYRDQSYRAEFDQYGKLKASFSYNQVPLWFGNVERTPYREETPGVFRLNDTIQAAVQGGTATLAAYASELRELDLRSRRDTTSGRFLYEATPHLDLSVAIASTKRSGAQPWGASFGFSDATVVPVPLDRRTNDVTAAAEWSNPRGSARLAYDGSWFDNGIEALVWDNPLRFTDTTTANAYSTGLASSQGRMSLWPDSSAHTVSGSGTLTLPHRSRLFGYVSLGTWLQNDTLLPYTINTAIAPIPLARETAEAKAVITSMNYRYTSRPTPTTYVTASYRLYDFDNQTEPFPLTDIVRLDGTRAPSPAAETEPFGYARHFGDVDVSSSRFRHVALRAGYGVERDHRTYRYVETTTDHQVRASVDSVSLPWGSARLQYDHSLRQGSGLDEQVFEEINEQQSLRQFDIANRSRDRVSAIVQYLPTPALGLSATASLGRERRPDSAFGLQDNDIHSVAVGADYTLTKDAVASVSYGYDAYGTLQRSRQANPPPDPTFFDERRDWQTRMNERVHTFSASLELPHVAPATSLRVAYDGVHDRSRYLYELAPSSTLTAVQQLPEVSTSFGLFSLDVRHTLSRRLAAGVGYRLDRFETNDFALGPGIMDTALIPTFLNLQYQWRPYDAHTAYLRLTYSF